ncbi:amino acid permease [Stygiolobus azoricus]|uniref:Amino acid permease n=1 Tax=Stygiolobus azoricus TaxID=41675 RepID=A0A650CPT2_9CREN|nr:amino acid permease [Stygiolobus azoricus]QGR19849.1 amino acid permease [Stygiolobus azoricus]
MKFLRESTGFVKEFSTFDAFALNFSFLGPAAGVAYPLFVAAFLPEASWTLAVIIGALLMVPVVINYYLLTVLIPRSGGDYIFVSRVMGPFLGSVLGMSLIMAFTMGFPVLAMLEVIMVIVPGLQSLGYVLGNKGLIDIGNAITSSPLELFVVTTLVIFIVFIISSSERLYVKMFRYLTLLQIAGTILMIVGLFTVNRYPVFTSPHVNLQTLSLSSIFVLSMFAFTNAPAFFAGEIKRVKKSFIAGYLISYAVATLFALLLVIGIERGFGKQNYINYVLNGWSLPMSTSSILSFAVYPFLNYPYIVVFLVISALSWYVLYAMINVGASSRILFSMSFDRLLPSFFAEVRRGIPIYSLVFSLALSMLFNFLEVYLGYSVSFAVDGLWFVIWNYLIVAISSIKYGKSDNKILVTSLLSVFTLSLVVVLTVLYGFLNSSFGSVIFQGNTAFNLATIVIPPLTGTVTYLTSKEIRKKQGIELSEIYKEIPPE